MIVALRVVAEPFGAAVQKILPLPAPAVVDTLSHPALLTVVHVQLAEDALSHTLAALTPAAPTVAESCKNA